MERFAIVVDSSADLTQEQYDAMHIDGFIPLSFSIDGKEYLSYPDERELTAEELYATLRNTKAVVGTALGIKPIIDLNSEGKLITQEKVRGKNNVYAALARHLEDADNLDVIYITHAGAPEEAKKLAETIKKNYKVGEIRYSSIGPVVGCHTGPGTIAVVFFGTRSDAK